MSPTYALAYYDRGHAWEQKGEYDKAIGDDSEAIRLDPKYGAAYRTRGALRFGQQNWAAAAEDFSQSHELNGKDAYSVLWLATAGMRQGAREWAARLQQQAGTLSGDWPMPVVKFYLGTLTAEQLLAAAGDPAEGKQQGRACETDFFLGEWQLGHGEKQAAVGNLRKAESTCPRTYLQYKGAAEELNRLEPALASARGN